MIAFALIATYVTGVGCTLVHADETGAWAASARRRLTITLRAILWPAYLAAILVVAARITLKGY